MKRSLLILAVTLAGSASVSAEESSSPQDLAHRAMERRAVEAVMPVAPNTPLKANDVLFHIDPVPFVKALHVRGLRH